MVGDKAGESPSVDALQDLIFHAREFRQLYVSRKFSCSYEGPILNMNLS